jgi:hypothetical protein
VAAAAAAAAELVSESHRKLAGIDDVFEDVGNWFRGVGNGIRRKILQVSLGCDQPLQHADCLNQSSSNYNSAFNRPCLLFGVVPSAFWWGATCAV